MTERDLLPAALISLAYDEVVDLALTKGVVLNNRQRKQLQWILEGLSDGSLEAHLAGDEEVVEE
jgi:hypothetical protein